MNKYLILLLLVLALILLPSCNQETQTNKTGVQIRKTIGSGFLSGRGDKEVPVWSEPGALNNPANIQPMVLIADTPLPVKVVERSHFKTGSTYFLIEFESDSGQKIEGWVARIYLFRDSNGIVYFEPNEITGQKIFSNNPYYSVFMKSYNRENRDDGTCMHLQLPKMLEEKRNQKRGEYETKQEYKERLSVMEPFYRSVKEEWSKKIYSIILRRKNKNKVYYENDYRKIKYDIDKSLLSISLFDVKDAEFSLDCNTDMVRNTTHFTLKNKSGIHKPFYVKNNRIVYIGSFDRDNAKKIAESSVYVVVGFSDVRLTDKKSELRVDDRDPSNPKVHWDDDAFFEPNLAYIFVYSEGVDKVIATYTSPYYKKNGLVRDLQIILAEEGYEVGVLDGKPGALLKQAIAKATQKTTSEEEPNLSKILARQIIYFRNVKTYEWYFE